MSSVEVVETMSSVICSVLLLGVVGCGWARASPGLDTRVTASRAQSDELDDRGDPHPAADAQRGEAASEVAALELVDEGAEQHRAGRAEWVAHGDGAAVDVGDLVGDPHVLHEAHGDRGERLVHLPQVDV